MRSAILFLCAFLLRKCVAEELDISAQVSSEAPPDSQVVDWDTASTKPVTLNNNVQVDDRYRPPQFGPIIMPLSAQPFGTRFLPQNGFQGPIYRIPLEPYSRNWTYGAEPYPLPPDAYRYPPANANLPVPPWLYYPQTIRLSSADRNQLQLSADRNQLPLPADRNQPRIPANPTIGEGNTANRDINERADIINSPLPYNQIPRSSRLDNARQINSPYGNIPEANYFQYRDGSTRSTGNSYPLPPYYIPQGILPPVGPNNNEERYLYPETNNFVRPPYVDRESGSELSETNIPTKEESASLLPAKSISPPESTSVESIVTSEQVQPILHPRRRLPPRTPTFGFPQQVPAPLFSSAPEASDKSPLASTPFESSVPADPVPPRFLPRRPLPFNGYPFGFPQQGFIPPYPLPPGIFPPAIPPPVFPNIPPPADENLLASDLARQAPAIIPTSEPESVPVELVPIANTPTKDPQIVGNDPDVVAANPNENRLPYEFGYAMNDGNGTDQHRREFSDSTGAISGSYGYRDPFGVYRLVNYIADKNGFRAFIQSNEPGVANPGSADVVVRVERPPPKAIEEGLKTLQLDAVEVPDDLQPFDLNAEGSEII